MAAATLARKLLSSNTNTASISVLKLIISPFPAHFHPQISNPPNFPLFLLRQSFSSNGRRRSRSPISSGSEPQRRNTLVNFSLSDSGSESEEQNNAPPSEPEKSKLPPPYDPFNKKPVIEEPEDPKNLQEVFHKIRSEGMINNAVKMFDGLSKDGLTHEALELFSQIKDKSQMPDIVAHTAVIEAYCEAGQPKEAHRVYQRMLVSGVLPNAYTYSVLIKALAMSGEAKMVKESWKYVREMVEKRGMRPNALTCARAFEGLVGVGMEEEGKDLLEMLKKKGVVPEEGKMREALKNTRGHVYRTLMNILYAK